LLSAAELDFATRETAGLPAWLRESSFRIWPLAEAKTLTLRLRNHDVLVKLRERSGVLVGDVCGFEPSVAALGAVRPGELIIFKPAHVFAVGA
jgi:hypothetical protein